MVKIPDGLLDAMRAAALDAGKEALRIKHEHAEDTTLKEDGSLVTIADPKCEDLIKAHLKPYLDQGFGFLGEETGFTPNSNGFDIVVDPIDGTTNYDIGNPNWVVSIGITYQGKPIAGVVYQPMLDKLYYAQEGQGAYLVERGQERRLRIPEAQPNAYVLETLFARHPDYEGQRAFNAQWHELIEEKTDNKKVARVRADGCPSVPLCMVAEGGYSGIVAKPIYMWDIAASYVIAKEAGAEIYLAKENEADTSPKATYSLVAARKDLFADIKRIFDQTLMHKAHIYRTAPKENIAAQFKADGIKYGITIGRRQPMHKVHLDCAKEIAASGLHPIIVIGSVNPAESPFHNPVDNPLTEAQQREQIRIAMEAAGIKDYTVLALPDRGDNELWAGGLSHLLLKNGINPSMCVSHYRTKAQDVLNAQNIIKPLSGLEKALLERGISTWESHNPEHGMDTISATPFRTMELLAAENQERIHDTLVAPDYVIQQAKQARESDPDKALLQEVPVSMLDLMLQRFRAERGLSTADVLQHQPAADLSVLEHKLKEVKAPPGTHIEGALRAVTAPTKGVEQ